MSNTLPTKQTIIDYPTPFIESTRPKEKPKYWLRRLGVAATTLTLLGIGVRGAAEVHDKLTTDNTTYKITANIVPNPTEGGREALQELIASGSAAERAAAEHVDVTELGAVIGQVVYEATGQTPRDITDNISVRVTYEADGDVVSAEPVSKE